jgi:hypothetical protein
MLREVNDDCDGVDELGLSLTDFGSAVWVHVDARGPGNHRLTLPVFDQVGQGVATAQNLRPAVKD